MTGSNAAQEAELAAQLTAFWKQAAPEGKCKRSELDLALPDGDPEAVISRDEFIVWLFKKPLGSPALLEAALKARACSLLALADQAPRLSIWPQGKEPAAELSDGVWEDIVERFATIRSAPACAAQHFLQVVSVGIDANSVAFPRMQPPPSWGPVHGQSIVASGQARQPDNVPFPLPHTCENAPHKLPPPDETAWAPGADAEAGAEWLEGLAVDINQLRQFSFYMAQMDMELEQWTVLEQGVIVLDECTVAQVQAAEFKELRGPPSEKTLRWRRRRLDQHFENPWNARCGEEVMPVLEREASLEERRARSVRDRAQEAAEYEERAKRGAASVAWPSEGKWPPVDKAWQQHVRWFAAWKARPTLKPRSSLPLKPLALQRSDSVESLKSWLSVSDISWIEVGSLASERGWEVVVQEADPELVLATDALRKLSKADIAKAKDSADPPRGMLLTLEAVCALLEVKPSWAESVKLLEDDAFVERLVNLRICVKQSALEAVSPYIAAEDFTPDSVAEGGSVCTCLCRWVRAVYKYHTLSHAAGKATHAQLAQKPKEQLKAEAAAALNGLSKACLHELKSLARPPRGVDDALFCLLELLAGLFAPVQVHRTGLPKVSWKAVQTMMGNPDELFSFLKSFMDLVEKGAVPQRNFQRAARRRDDMGVMFTPDAMRKKSMAAATLCSWVAHMLAFCELVMPPEARHSEKLLQANPAPRDANAAPLCKADVVELKALGIPPQQVKTVVIACSMLLQNGVSDWKGAQVMLNDLRFLNRLVSFDPKDLSLQTLDEVEACMGPLLHDIESVKQASKAAASLGMWVGQTVQAARAMGG
mmetsp:Transcript_2448/g.5714  ORF Transcript_2448/g.5714 Transcript_2448/m.5714 type:complete len:822 (+) Transcript_2448:28-2493(+)